MKKFLMLAALLVSATAALAQTGTPKSSSAISSEINSQLPSGAPGGISAFSLRQVLQDMNASPPAAPVIYMALFGVTGDGVTNNDANIAAGLAAIPGNGVGAIVVFPCGTIVISSPIILTQQGIYEGCGINDDDDGFPLSTSGTVISTTSASNDVIQITNIGISVRDMTLLSSVSAGSRTGAGLHIVSGPNISTGSNWVYVHRVKANGHHYGFRDEVPNVEFDHIYAGGNNSHGIFLDGSVNKATVGASEVVCYECQGNGNTGAGIFLGGTIVGVQLVHPVAASNGAGGIVLRANDNSGSFPVEDVYITEPEISTNTGTGLDISSNIGGVGITVANGLVEENTVAGINCGKDVSYANFTNLEGGQGAGTTWLIADCQQSTYSNLSIAGAASGTVNGIEVGADSAHQVFANIVMSTCATAGSCSLTLTNGFKYDALAGSVFINNVDVAQATNAFTGTLPTGSVISGSTPTLAPAPVANSCTGFSLAAGGNDYAGTISLSLAGTCSVTFGHTFASAPTCTLSPYSAATSAQVSAISATGFTATFGTNLTKFAYACSGA